MVARVACTVVLFLFWPFWAFCQYFPPVASYQNQPVPLVAPRVFGVYPEADQALGNHSRLFVRKFINSFTSYEFRDPFPPYQDPLSRLEFAFDQWFGGIASSYTAPGWSLSIQGEINLNREGGLPMQDSDWDDPSNPNQKTIFSESKNRLNRGLLLDLELTAWTPIGELINFRPVIGYRYQYFHFLTHDGYLTDISGLTGSLPGDGIEFKQTYHHFYLGAVWTANLMRPTPFTVGPPVRCRLQGDCALVDAKNEDFHLLRQGERLTEENTTGYCWHLSLNLALMLPNSVRTGLEVDFKRIYTKGTHRLINRPLDVDFSFDGAKVWSDQASISAFAQIDF